MKKAVKICIFVATVTIVLCAALISVGAEAICYAKSLLSGNEAYVYERLAEEVLCDTPAQKIELDTDRRVNAEQMGRALELFLSDHPECFWMDEGVSYSYLSDGTVTSIQPNYTVAISDIPSMRAELEDEINKIFSEMPSEVRDGSAYKKSLYLHDALASHVDYQHVGYHQTAYGALVNKKAVCAGYAAAYQILLQRAGIRAWTVSGTSINPSSGEPEGHAWNVLWINGKCLYTDVTWDDQGEHLYRVYLNLDLEEMEKTHFVDESVYELPKCGHSDMSYFEVRGNTLSDEDGANELAKMLREIDEGERYAEFYYEGNDIKDWLGKNIREVYAMLGGVGGVSYSTKRVDNEIHLTVKGDFSGEVSVEPEKTPDGDVTDAPTQKPTEAPTEKPTEVITDKTYEKHSEGDADNGLGVDAIEKIVGGCNLSVSTGTVIVTTMCAGVLVASRKKKQ